jgi:glycolate oxidase iron-sulfur subunit
MTTEADKMPETAPLNLGKLVAFKGDAPSYNDMTRCIHCGLCLNQCPTYRETGNEAESPRGRLYLMRAFAEGKIEATSEGLNQHLDSCLQCRACETACPSGVKYGMLAEYTITEIKKQKEAVIPPTRTEKMLKWLIFRQLFPYPKRLRLFGLATRLYQKTPLQTVTRKFGILKSLPFRKLGLARMADLEQMLPPISDPIFTPPETGLIPAKTEQKYRVALFSGCIMSLAFAKVNEATVRVLTRNNCEVVVPKSQICCGALHLHNGDRDYAKEMAKRNIEAFEEAEQTGEFDAIIINAAGCGSTLKEYGELLKNEPEYYARAVVFDHKVKDITEFLASIDLNTNFGKLDLKVTYQDACHLIHGQKISQQPRKLIKSIPGVEFIEMRNSDKCCGSAGIYNVTNYDMSMQILDHKMDYVKATNANCILTANPGCQIQLQVGVERSGMQKSRAQQVEVKHIVEILDEAYRAAEE